MDKRKYNTKNFFPDNKGKKYVVDRDNTNHINNCMRTKCDDCAIPGYVDCRKNPSPTCGYIKDTYTSLSSGEIRRTNHDGRVNKR